MAALSEYPTNGAIVRGDPLAIPVNITVDGAPIDTSAFDWRAQVRTGFDGALITEFTCSSTTPAGGTVPSTVLMELEPDQTDLLDTGMIFDLEQRDATTLETIRTWWICTKLNVQKDVSRDVVSAIRNTSHVDVMKARG